MFLEKRTTSYKKVEVKNTSNQNFGGYKTYYKLYKQSLVLFKDNNVNNIFAYLSLFVQALFKPLKQFYSYTTIIEGTYLIINGHFQNESLKKSITYKLFNIPFLVNNKKLTEDDIKELLK